MLSFSLFFFWEGEVDVYVYARTCRCLYGIWKGKTYEEEPFWEEALEGREVGEEVESHLGWLGTSGD